MPMEEKVKHSFNIFHENLLRFFNNLIDIFKDGYTYELIENSTRKLLLALLSNAMNVKLYRESAQFTIHDMRIEDLITFHDTFHEEIRRFKILVCDLPGTSSSLEPKSFA